jgi:hypothetical protein
LREWISTTRGDVFGELYVPPVGEVVRDPDDALDAFADPDQPLGVEAGRDLARERDDTVADVDLHALRVGAQHLVGELGADRRVVAQEDREMTPRTRPASSHTGIQRRWRSTMRRAAVATVVVGATASTNAVMSSAAVVAPAFASG